MDKIIKSLSDLSKEISTAKTNLAVLEIKKADALKELKEEFGIKSVDAAEKVIAAKSIEVKKLKESIETKFNLLKEEYSW
jgi:deoxyribodipyrimidine photolyase